VSWAGCEGLALPLLLVSFKWEVVKLEFYKSFKFTIDVQNADAAENAVKSLNYYAMSLGIKMEEVKDGTKAV
jgi:hypothetical protein